MLKYVVTLWLMLSVIHSKTLPKTITRCAKSDPNFNECFAKSIMAAYREFTNGNRAYGLKRLDPIFIEILDVSGGEGVTLRQIYRNAFVYGLTTANVTNMDADFKGDKCFLKMDHLIPEVVMDADYTLDGHVLILPINGHGKCHHVLHDLYGKFEMHCERVRKNEKVFLRVSNFTLKMQPRVIIFGFKNIIPGNEKLSEEVLKTINENSFSVAQEIKPALEFSFADIFRQFYNGFFAKMPEDDLFLP